MQNKINNIHTLSTINEFHNLLEECASNYEMKCLVYVYDTMLEKKIEPTDKTYKIINNLHSKTIKENNSISIPNKNFGASLQPRRRIHKIMKGYFYKKALLKKDIVISYLKKLDEINYDGKDKKQKNQLCKKIQKNTPLSSSEVNFIIGYLNRINYFDNNKKSQKSILSFFSEN